MADIALGIMGGIIVLVGFVTIFNMMSKPKSANSGPVTVAARRSERRLSRKSVG